MLEFFINSFSPLVWLVTFSLSLALFIHSYNSLVQGRYKGYWSFFFYILLAMLSLLVLLLTLFFLYVTIFGDVHFCCDGSSPEEAKLKLERLIDRTRRDTMYWHDQWIATYEMHAEGIRVNADNISDLAQAEVDSKNNFENKRKFLNNLEAKYRSGNYSLWDNVTVSKRPADFDGGNAGSSSNSSKRPS